MNLIMSAVEETIVIVEPVEGASQNQGSVNVSHVYLIFRLVFTRKSSIKYVKRKMEMLFVRGDGVILVGTQAIILHASVDRDVVGLTTVKNIVGYRLMSKLTAAS